MFVNCHFRGVGVGASVNTCALLVGLAAFAGWTLSRFNRRVGDTEIGPRGFCANLLFLRFGSIWFQQGNFIAFAIIILAAKRSNYRL
jgi:hypothetical protein